MPEPHRSGVSRRSVLGSIATVGTTSLVGLGSQRVSASDEWQCNSDCPQSVVANKNFQTNGSYEGESAIHWLSSEYYDGKGWEHELSFSMGAASTDLYTYGKVLQGQRYKIQGPDGAILPRVANDKHGEYPGPNSGQVAQWAAGLLQTTVSTLSGTAAPAWFYLITNTLRDALAPVDGFDTSVPDGFKHTNSVQQKSWRECTSFHRFQYESNFFSPELNIRTSISDYVTALGLHYWDNIDYSMTNYSHPTTLDDPTQLTDEDIRKLPVRRVSEDSQRTKTVDGEEYQLTHVATENPFKNIEVNKSRTKEREEE